MGIIKDGRLGLQRRAPKRNGWTLKRRALFLDELARTSNVRMAAAAAGMSDRGAHHLRARDPAFADLWAQAREQAGELLEDEVVALSLRHLRSEDNPDEEREVRPGPPIDAKFALDVLKARAAASRSRPHKQSALTPEEVEAELAERLEALHQRLARERDAR